jgi:hypothetical protein
MNCARVRRLLPGFHDRALSADDRQRVQSHLHGCTDCGLHLEGYARLFAKLARVERPTPPAGLATRLRMEVSRVRQAEPWHLRVWSRMHITLQNFFAPLAVPTTGGLASALLVFAFMGHGMMFGRPVGAVANDVPINLIRPAEVEYLAPFALSPSNDDGKDFEDAIIVETVVDAVGQAVSYEILAGPSNLNTRRQLDQVVFFSKFRPQTSFGRPESGGKVLLSFREIRVKG